MNAEKIKAKKIKVLLIGKGGKNTGMGHLVRLGSLYDTLTPFYDTTFLVNNESCGVEFTRKKEYKFHVYNNSRLMVQFIKKTQPYDLIIFDMLYIPPYILKAIKKYCRFLIVFDDMQRLPKKKVEAEIICPQVTFKNKVEYKNGHCILKGTDYFPLRNTFILDRRGKVFRSTVKNVLISLGGAPPLKYSLLLARMLDDYLDKRISIHVGLGYDTKKSINDFSKRVIFHRRLNDMSALIAKMDLGVISGGFIKFELMCIGIPFCIISRNPHQGLLAKKFSNQGYGMYLGNITNIKTNPENFYRRIEGLLSEASLRRKMFLQYRKLVDGRGSIRCLNLVKKLLKQGERYE